MYRQDTNGGCGCGGSSARSVTTRRQTPGRIDSSGNCVCGECDACNGLQCLCRPRFFDGQLLTAADFKRLDRYITAKDRLHNKYLHGVGVVCGLEVVCSPCDDTVTVRTGYALGPCGEDIVVCQDATVDVAALIRAQRSGQSPADCAPYSEPRRTYESARQKWILGICYDEHQAHPVSSLKQSGCSCGGSCGGGGGCSGGCKGGSKGGCRGGCGGSCSSGPSKPPACEPTQICEGYRFTLTKAPAEYTISPAPHSLGGIYGSRVGYSTGFAEGALPMRVMSCVIGMRERISQFPEQVETGVLVDYAGNMQDEISTLIEEASLHHCGFARRLNDVVIPEPDDAEANALARGSILKMSGILVDLYRECICAALLPQCEDGCADDCVPLAVLTVRSSDLQVLDICNWSQRKFALTMPNLQYWLGWLPIFGSLRRAVEELCCRDNTRPKFNFDENMRVSSMVSSNVGYQPAAENVDVASEGYASKKDFVSPSSPDSFVAMGEQFRSNWSPLSGLEATVLGSLGAMTPDNQPLASDLELGNPMAALALGRLGIDVGAQILPPDLVTRIVAAQQPAYHERLRLMEESMQAMQQAIDEQQVRLDTFGRGGADQ